MNPVVPATASMFPALGSDADRKKMSETDAAASACAVVIISKKPEEEGKAAQSNPFPDHIVAKASAYMQDPDRLKAIRAEHLPGMSKIYIAKDLPGVLIKDPSDCAWQRFENMEKARKICQEMGARHLYIPQAKECTGFLLEERLPVGACRSKELMGIYVENQKKCSEPIRELTEFVCRGNLTDFIHSQRGSIYCSFVRDWKSKSLGFPQERYDNVPLYVVVENFAETIKVGLIDLDTQHFYACPLDSREADVLTDLAYLFPYHVETIKEVGRKYFPDLDNLTMRSSGKKLADIFAVRTKAGLALLKSVYVDHRSFIEKKGISPKDVDKLFEISQARMQELQKAAFSKLIEASKGKGDFFSLKDVLKENPEQLARQFVDDTLPKVVDCILEILTIHLKQNIAEHGGKESVTSYATLLSCRTLKTYLAYVRPPTNNPVITKTQELTALLKKSCLAEEFIGPLEHSIVEFILKEFVKGGEIADFDILDGAYRNLCVFC